MSTREAGLRRGHSAGGGAWIIMKGAVSCCLRVARRHSRRYSQSSLSGSAAVIGEGVPGDRLPPAKAGTDVAEIVLLWNAPTPAAAARRLGFATATGWTSQEGAAPQMSQAAQDFHLDRKSTR